MDLLVVAIQSLDNRNKNLHIHKKNARKLEEDKENQDKISFEKNGPCIHGKGQRGLEFSRHVKFVGVTMRFRIEFGKV